MCSIGALGECRFSGPRRTTTPFIAWWKRRFASRRSASVPIAGCRIIGTLSSGPNATATFPGSCSGWPTCTPNAGNGRNCASATGTCIKGGSSRFPSRATSISIAWCGTWSGTPCGPDLSSARRIGNGEVCSSVRGEPRGPLLAEWPLPEPSDWIEQVNMPQTEAELEAIRRCVRRGSPYGNAAWTEQTAEQLGLQSTLRRRGRPHKSRS